jgi:hypothetical protein
MITPGRPFDNEALLVSEHVIRRVVPDSQYEVREEQHIDGLEPELAIRGPCQHDRFLEPILSGVQRDQARASPCVACAHGCFEQRAGAVEIADRAERRRTRQRMTARFMDPDELAGGRAAVLLVDENGKIHEKRQRRAEPAAKGFGGGLGRRVASKEGDDVSEAPGGLSPIVVGAAWAQRCAPHQDSPGSAASPLLEECISGRRSGGSVGSAATRREGPPAPCSAGPIARRALRRRHSWSDARWRASGPTRSGITGRR